jgi:hypothetical protein
MNRIFLKSTAGALVLLVLAANAALADQSQGDNDVSAPGLQHSFVVSSDPGATVQLTPQITVDYQGSKHLESSQTVVFSVAQQQTSLPAGYAVDDINVAVPAEWSDSTVTGTGNVSFTAPATAGSYTYVLKYDPVTFECASAPCLSGQPGFVIQLSVNEVTPPPDGGDGDSDVNVPVAVLPSVTINQPLDGAVLHIGDELNAEFSCSSDSPVTQCAGSVDNDTPIDTSTVGWHTLTVSAKDADGDETTSSVSYRVIFPFAFVAPTLETPGTNASIVAGKKLTVRFTMFGYYGANVLHGWPRHQQLDATSRSLIGRMSVSRVRRVKYDATTDQYSFIWATKKSWAGTERQLIVRLEDGMHHSATFMLVVSFV